MALPSNIDFAVRATDGLPTLLISEASKSYPKPDGIKFTYGTAGVRTKGDVLESTCFRLALISALRSKRMGGKVVGMMVTASHNPEPDNGLKAVDPRGEMLASNWEPYCTEAANALTDEELFAVLQRLIKADSINLQTPAVVVYAHDTRPSSPKLVKAIEAGLAAIGAEGRNGGLLTTPQLHYLVKAYNTQSTPDPYGEPTEEGYYKKLADAFQRAIADKPATSPLTVDCANGVGAISLQRFQKYLPASALQVRALRTSIDTAGALNNGCGADHVKTKQALPSGFEKEVAEGERLCSFDGDADRIVYYYLNGHASQKESFRLLDGDRIAALVADYISELVKRAGIADEIKIGCVQTAYANGGSTKYLSQRVPVVCTSTGVKHLHHAAESFDVGVYFEANGHGTVLFSDSAQSLIRGKISSSSPQGDSQSALSQLSNLIDLINQTVGDALSDMLLVEVVLRQRDWEPAHWDSLYTDLPNKLLKVIVPDRALFTTTDADRKLVTPDGLQQEIDKLVGKYLEGRSFVRPSGTEDCVRVYAEARIQQEMEELANKVAKLVTDAAKNA
ncbi:Phosphoacetylglucosamine mutase [Ceraceosorus guamensis]|uniref:Phosphoacetylglucosamine mutase n=1 Tax=Ceraceosorus guamensis TaxID=1522189 RepID=A0A316VX79_9BASI|nr:Phosphoacetylglucosamine mutase [Ceraceosorus guamensis]PWN41043.1 Phosphoacetylglucosamine mutase [Ceraceosorus guamensis]